MPRVKVKKFNQITIPKKLGSYLGIKEGDYLELETKGTFVILKKVDVVEEESFHAEEDESWFLSPEWQEKEREADKAIAEGRVSRLFDTAEEAIKTLRSGYL